MLCAPVVSVAFHDDVAVDQPVGPASNPWAEVDGEMGVGAGHPEALAGDHGGQRPVDEEVAATTKPEGAEIDFRVGSRQR